jgi:hypothetical protein
MVLCFLCEIESEDYFKCMYCNKHICNECIEYERKNNLELVKNSKCIICLIKNIKSILR